VKHWRETGAIFDRLARIAEAGRQAALATVIRIEGSAYRRPGAKFLVEDGGTTTGSVSGGCLESDVQAYALEAIKTGRRRLLRYQTGSDEETVWGMGLGCEGTVEVFVQAAGADLLRDAGGAARSLFAQDVRFALGTFLSGPHEGRTFAATRGTIQGGFDPGGEALALASARLESGETGVDERGGSSLFVEVHDPPPHLFLFGAGDARPLAPLAAQRVRDHGGDHLYAYLTSERFPSPARLLLRRPEDGVAGLGLSPRHSAVVLTHAVAHDKTWLEALLNEPLGYIGLLGPRARRKQILQKIGVSAPERLYAPVGLDIAPDGAEQVAVSIVAEMLAVRAGRPPMHLREKAGGIHDR
jgi:xanthine/CO dehydrogenase XdhC/CoxF family maturation factor